MPVEKVSWDDANEFAERMTATLPGLAVRLPTEAEWEYACRAGTPTRYWFGDEFDQSKVNCDKSVGQTSAVKSYPANRLGLFDVHGNVWEWCADYRRDSYDGGHQVDAQGPEEGSARVFRGGSWINYAGNARSACRYGNHPGLRLDDRGFRCLSQSSAEPSEAATAQPVAEQGSQPHRFGGAEEIFRTRAVKADEASAVKLESLSGTTIGIISDVEEIWLDRTPRPAWAKAFGHDLFGLFADFGISAEKSANVRQRLRWIPPGTFRMGSPPDEPGRSEGKTQHDVTLSAGFWMFETPCTQALWEAVLGENPSRFPDPHRPVEKVDWKQANAFATALTEKLQQPDLNLTLPTEAQWEYACRAGTTTAIYSGSIKTLGDAPALDTIAWYAGNSATEFDHDQPQDVSQHDWIVGDAAGSRQVKQKRPNPWGLYDILGNVWEWCSDRHADYEEEPQIDPEGPDEGSDHVVRGGGWFHYARYARSAYRDGIHPGLRHDSLGFRCLSSASPSGPEAEQVSAAKSAPRDEAAEQQRTQ